MTKWAHEIVRYVPGLKIYSCPIPCQLLHLCSHSAFHSSPQHLPHCCLLQLESPSAAAALSNTPLGPAPFALPVELCKIGPAVGSEPLQCAVPRAALPPLAYPALPLFSYLQIHVALWLFASRSWKDELEEKQSLYFLFFFNYDMWTGLGFF